MEKLYYLLAAFGALAILIAIFNRPKQTSGTYVTRRIQTEIEGKFYSFLLGIIPSDFYVFPQIHLASMLEVRSTARNRQAAFNKISRKSVDYAIVERAGMTTVLVIELDDSTHLRRKRQSRDNFVNREMAEVGIPVLRIKIPELNDYDMVKMRIIAELQHSEQERNMPKSKN